MDVVKFSIEKPVTVIVAVILIIIFGLMGLFGMPYQLSPSVTEPEITVTTMWPGATPYEIEREIIEEQEQTLKGIPGLIEMESSSLNSRGTVTLRFKIGTNVDDALLRVSNKLGEVPSYPENVDRPVINATGAATSPVIWIIFRLAEEPTPDNPDATSPDALIPDSISNYKSYFEDEIRQHIERVEGVADLFIGGGTMSELHVVLKPEKLAGHGITVIEVIAALQGENINVSAGTMDIGRRNYRIRTVSEFNSIKDVEETIIRSTGQRRVKVSDIANVLRGHEKRTVAMMYNKKEGMAIGIKPEPGTNILELTDKLEKVVKNLNEDTLKPKGLYMDWVYDQRPYIRGAIGLVRKNILIGGVLAVIVLVLFLGSLSSTVVVATAIPISVIGTFFFMNLLGRSLNVVSLAGIAFAVGMLVDSAIVVLENIDRHRRTLGKGPYQAAYDGTLEVWGAIIASTLTTVAVFLPVVFMQQEAGQLFRDIAIAVTAAVTLSLFVSISVIPTFARFLFGFSRRKKAMKNPLSGLARMTADCIMGVVGATTKNWFTRATTVIVLTAFSIGLTFALLPKMEYLPQGNRNLLISIMIPPPGLSYETRREIGMQVFDYLDPYVGPQKNDAPGIDRMFYVGADMIMLSGVITTHDQRAAELLPVLMKSVNSVPGMFGVSMQAGIFQTSIGRGRSIEVDVSGDSIEQVMQVAGMMFGMLSKEIPGSQIRPVPSLEVLYPEVRLLPIRDRLRASGMSARDLGITLDVLMDGRKVGEFKQKDKKKVNLVLKASEREITTPEELHRMSIATPGGKVVPISTLAELQRTTGITEIRHLERRRTVTLQVTPPASVPIQAAMETIDEKVIPAVAKTGMLKTVRVSQSGVADKLTETRAALQWNFVLAALIAYLLMSALFGNFIYPLVIMFSVPLAWGGGFLGLKLQNLFITPQPLDVLTMLGFIILIGVVVNNAILIVHQSLNNVRYNNMAHREAVLEATKTRLRPIYMSAATSIFGMLPLVLSPGPGSELYRGIGSVILGGMALSTVFTVFVIPSMLMFFIGMEKPGTSPEDKISSQGEPLQ